MSEDSSFAPPPFDPAQALVGLKRQLRDMRLAERAGLFELKGHAVVRLDVSAGALVAGLVKRPQRTPEWTTHTLRNAADVRRFVEQVKRQLAAWSDE